MSDCASVSLVSKKKKPQLHLYQMLHAAGLPQPYPEYGFHPSRKWRFDYAWPQAKIALEVEGGIFFQGNKRCAGRKSRHSTTTGMLGDMEKYNEAAALGWRIVRCVPSQLDKRPTLDLLGRLLGHLRGVAT